MQGIYPYIPETNYVPREYSVAAILLLLFMVLISFVSVLNLLYLYISIFRSVCAVPNMVVFCSSYYYCYYYYYKELLFLVNHNSSNGVAGLATSLQAGHRRKGTKVRSLQEPETHILSKMPVAHPASYSTGSEQNLPRGKKKSREGGNNYSTPSSTAVKHTSAWQGQ